jgi:hypothetical protein
MLTRVDIKNYRGFESYQLKGLANVNLLVGKNNCGKTALLEGLQFLVSGGNPSVLEEAAERRGEIIVLNNTSGTLIRLVDIIHFFHGHALELNSHGPEFEISESTVLSLSCCESGGKNSEVKVAINLPSSIRVPQVGLGSTSPGQLLGFMLKGQLVISDINAQQPENKQTYPIAEGGGVDFTISHLPNFTKPNYFVGQSSLRSWLMAKMWDDLAVKGQEEDVFSAMQLLERDLVDVLPLTGSLAQSFHAERGGFVVRLTGVDERIPLGSLGDGMRRIMALAMGLASSQGGNFFVDEIDTGLHYSILSDMWKMIIRRAVETNTQVFATTHSWDCIAGLADFCENEPDFMANVSVQKIDRGIPHSIPFTGESIVQMTRADIDPR